MKKIILEPGDGTHYEAFIADIDKDQVFFGFRVGSDCTINSYIFGRHRLDLLARSYVQEKLGIEHDHTAKIASVFIATVLGRTAFDVDIGDPEVMKRVEEIAKSS